MAKIEVYKNEVRIDENLTADTLKCLSQITTIDSPNADTVVAAVKRALELEPAFVESFGASGEPTDNFRVYTYGTRNGAQWDYNVTGTRSQLHERMVLALRAKDYTLNVQIIKGESEANEKPAKTRAMSTGF
jgi:hypothetical protein